MRRIVPAVFMAMAFAGCALPPDTTGSALAGMAPRERAAFLAEQDRRDAAAFIWMANRPPATQVVVLSPHAVVHR